METYKPGASMAPQEAYSRLKSGAHAQDSVVIRALETIAAMRVEEDPTIVDPETNGGKYETLRHTRLVSEWVPEETA